MMKACAMQLSLFIMAWQMWGNFMIGQQSLNTLHWSSTFQVNFLYRNVTFFMWRFFKAFFKVDKREVRKIQTETTAQQTWLGTLEVLLDPHLCTSKVPDPSVGLQSLFVFLYLLGMLVLHWLLPYSKREVRIFCNSFYVNEWDVFFNLLCSSDLAAVCQSTNLPKIKTVSVFKRLRLILSQRHSWTVLGNMDERYLYHSILLPVYCSSKFGRI